jgi:hypothetical protein
MISDEHLKLTSEQLEAFSTLSTFGTPCNVLASWMNLDSHARNEYLLKNPDAGIPVPDVMPDGTIIGDQRNELKWWVKAARTANGKDMGIAIKADKTTPYSAIKKVMDSLREVDENRYNLITALKGVEE